MLSYIFLLLHFQDGNDCEWLTPTDEDNLLKCRDGSYCNGWSCCNDHNGRAKCPPNKPMMCAKEKSCAGGADFCCSNEDCKNDDGPRPCGIYYLKQLQISYLYNFHVLFHKNKKF